MLNREWDVPYDQGFGSFGFVLIMEPFQKSIAIQKGLILSKVRKTCRCESMLYLCRTNLQGEKAKEVGKGLQTYQRSGRQKRLTNP